MPGDGPPEDDAGDAGDRVRRRVLWALPTGLYLLGSRSADGSRRNLMTLSWALQVATAPKLVAVGVETGAFTHGLVAEGGVFALSILRREDRAVVRRFAKPAEDDPEEGTLGGQAVFAA
ncbi:MAG: flavin reductase family protein, partial [Acidimicrobiales bacterium]